MFLGLSVCLLDYSKSYERILMKFLGGLSVGRGTRTKWLDFGGNPRHDPDPGIFLKDIYIYFSFILWVAASLSTSVGAVWF